jgi:hypothetical protein
VDKGQARVNRSVVIARRAGRVPRRTRREATAVRRFAKRPTWSRALLGQPLRQPLWRWSLGHSPSPGQFFSRCSQARLKRLEFTSVPPGPCPPPRGLSCSPLAS